MGFLFRIPPSGDKIFQSVNIGAVAPLLFAGGTSTFLKTITTTLAPMSLGSIEGPAFVSNSTAVAPMSLDSIEGLAFVSNSTAVAPMSLQGS